MIELCALLAFLIILAIEGNTLHIILLAFYLLFISYNTCRILSLLAVLRDRFGLHAFPEREISIVEDFSIVY
jgi:hypothetical protein